MKKNISIMLGFAFLLIGATTAYAQYTSSHTSGRMCTADAHVCPNGTTVGRTGPNCQFVCPSTSYTPTPVNTGCYNPNYNNQTSGCVIRPQTNSYTYVNGCYTYYYNGDTRSTSVVSYNCQTTNNNNYNYNQPNYQSYYTTPSYSNSYSYSPYYTYQYSNGSWYPGSTNNYYNSGYGSNNYGYSNNSYGYYDTSYNNGYNYNNSYVYPYDTNYGYNNYYTNSSCYYQSGYYVCR